MGYEIRLIQPSDNIPLRQLFKSVLLELECFESQYLSNPDELFDLYADYQQPNSKYYVIHDQESGKIQGGGGYAPLANSPDICEVQKMYLAAELRGKGFGPKLLDLIIQETQGLGFDTLYLETMTNMTSAVRLYEKMGFTNIPGPLGSTGHICCTIFMTRSLSQSVAT